MCSERSKKRQSRANLIDCICPGCGAAHKREMFWTGSIPARLFCVPYCKQTADRFSRESIDPMCIYVSGRDLDLFLHEQED